MLTINPSILKLIGAELVLVGYVSLHAFHNVPRLDTSIHLKFVSKVIRTRAFVEVRDLDVKDRVKELEVFCNKENR